MKLARWFGVLFGLAALASAAEPVVVAVRAGRLIDPKAGVVVPGAVVLIENGRVKAVGPGLAIPAGVKVIDLSSMTVLPGLMDCHTHLVGDYVNDSDPLTELKESAADRAYESVPNAKATLEAGFTTVRDVGTYRAFVDVAMRGAIAKGYFPGPRMFVAGAYLTITGGGGAMSGDLAPDIGLPWDLKFGVADGVDQVRQRVRDIAQHGVDLIKLIATGRISRARLRSARRRVLLRRDPRGRRGSGAQGPEGRRPCPLDRGHQERRARRRRLDRARHVHRRRGPATHEGAGHLSRGRHLRRRVHPPGQGRRHPAGLRRRSSPRATRSSARTSGRRSRWASRSRSARTRACTRTA